MLQIDRDRIEALEGEELSHDRTGGRTKAVNEFFTGIKPLTQLTER
jgi:hypothetical protein